MTAKSELAKYEIRSGKNGEPGIFLRAYNVRVATFSPGSNALQELLKKLCDDAACNNS